jgi:hypothetical protein
MIRKVLIISVLLVFAITSSAFAAIETQGDVVFRDALYGAVIGGIIGSAFYIADQDDFAQKVGIGVLVGTVGGVAFGVMETRSVVEIENNEVKFALPTPVIQKRDGDIMYSTSILKFDLD